ncbi:MAG TPA: hypothetical protein PKL91_08615, partial [Bacteroidales bacterium]|nr:hypothetical protein [Bacteroidales bacterium]
MGVKLVKAACQGTCTTCDSIYHHYACTNGETCTGPGDLGCSDGSTCVYKYDVCNGEDTCSCDSIIGECGCTGGCKPGQVAWSNTCCTPNWPNPLCTSDCGVAGYSVYDGCGNSHWCPATPACCSESDPDAPALVSPVNGTIVNTGSAVNLDWNAISDWGEGCPNTNKYSVCVSSNQISCDYVWADTNTSTTNYSWTPSVGDSYVTWLIQSNNDSRTKNSETRNFCVEGEFCSLQCGQLRNCSGNCPIDENLTNCSSTISSQYIETPQTTGTVWVRATGCNAGVEHLQFQTWNLYNNKDDVALYGATNQGGGTWQANLNVASHQPSLGNTIKSDAYSWGCNRDIGHTKYIGTTSLLVTPKTCSVTVSNPVGTQTGGVTITTTGDANINPGSDVVRSFIENLSFTTITGGVTYDYGGNNGLVADQVTSGGGYVYYDLTNAHVNSTNSSTVNSSYTVHAPPGNYYVHCDVPNDLNGNFVKCSGNPNCSQNGGSLTCTDWRSCSGNDYATFSIDAPPVFDNDPPGQNLILENDVGTIVPMENMVGLGTSGNHTCQSIFHENRKMKFVVKAEDPNGGGEIEEMHVRFRNGSNYPLMVSIRAITSSPVSSIVSSGGAIWDGSVALGGVVGLGRGVTFPVDLTSNFPDGVYEMQVRVVDRYGAESGWVSSNRYLKVWNCQVPVSGNLYDGSADHSCAGGFNTLADSAMEFNALVFNNSTKSVVATVTVPNSFVVGMGNLIWNRSYLPLINGGNILNPDGSLSATGRLTRMTDLGTGALTCPITNQFNLNVSPYSANPSAKIDFSFIRDQESWYQVRGGGVRAGNSIESGVPVTANALERYLTLGRNLMTTIDNGVVSYANNFSNTNGYNDEAYGSPHSWWKNSSLLPAIRYGYQYFYNNLYVKAGVGVTGDTWDEKPSEGVFFVNGNLNIDSDFTLATEKFFMVVVSGNITISNTVNQIDGIYVSDGELSATGNSVNALIINGMIFSRSNVRLARSFVDKTLNNTAPATVVNYQPGLLFNMPVKISKVISGWRVIVNAANSHFMPDVF